MSKHNPTDDFTTPSKKRATVVFDEQIATCSGVIEKQIIRFEDSSDTEDEIITPRKRVRKLADSSSDSDSGSPNFKKIIYLGKENDSPNIPKGKSLLKGKAKPLKAYSQKGTPRKEVGKKDRIKKDNLPSVIEDSHSEWKHDSLDFLKPDKIRDGNQRTPSDPHYDPKTLYVPKSFLKDLTPAMRQWWQIKKQHMDSVIFFKVEEFYELYHMDAMMGVRHLGLSYMKGEFAYCRFPECVYFIMASDLIEKNVKVARVEETEKPEMMAKRCKRTANIIKFDRIVKRELCQVSSKATCVYTAQMPEAPNDVRNYLYAISMKRNETGNTRFGVCFVETSVSTFYMSEFDDDRYFSRLVALLAEYPATLILTERGAVKKKLGEFLLNLASKGVLNDSLLPKSQFYTASDTLEKLSTARYFRIKDNFRWPEFFKKIADDCIPKPEFELTLKSLGACLWYLEYSKLDIQVLSAVKFEWYDPLDMTMKEAKRAGLERIGKLRSALGHCETAFGKKMLQRWISRPLCDRNKLKERQMAVDELRNNPRLLKNARAVLKEMPDLERLLAKIHVYGNIIMATDHPDGRAVFYESATYSKTKITDLANTLRAFEKAQNIAIIFHSCESRLLREITQFRPEGANVDLSEILEHFKIGVDQEAEEQRNVIPKEGQLVAFDNIEETIDGIKKKLEGTKGGGSIYSTSTTRQLLAAMLKAEDKKEEFILDLNRAVFEYMSRSRELFEQVVRCLTVLDVLCSLAE